MGANNLTCWQTLLHTLSFLSTGTGRRREATGRDVCTSQLNRVFLSHVHTMRGLCGPYFTAQRTETGDHGRHAKKSTRAKHSRHSACGEKARANLSKESRVRARECEPGLPRGVLASRTRVRYRLPCPLLKRHRIISHNVNGLCQTRGTASPR